MRKRIIIILVCILIPLALLILIMNPVHAQAGLNNEEFEENTDGWSQSGASGCFGWDEFNNGEQGVARNFFYLSGCLTSYRYQQFSIPDDSTFIITGSAIMGVGSGEAWMRIDQIIEASWVECDYLEEAPEGAWTEIQVSCTGPGTFRVVIWGGAYDYVRLSYDEEEPPPPGGPVDPGATCSFNYSTTITSTGGTTVTEEYSYTVPANLVSNYGFEESDGVSPADWTVTGYTPPIGIFTLLFYGSGIFDARTGFRYIRPGADDSLVLTQDMPVYSPGIYQYGLYYRCSELDGSGCSFYNSVGITFDYDEYLYTVLGPTNSPTYYTTISDTIISAGSAGSAWIALDLSGPVANWENDEIFIDDVFVWPIDDTGQILCDPDFYPVPPGQPITTTAPTPTNCQPAIGNWCFPPVLDSTCWQCQRPTNILAIGDWLMWLFCGVRNLFFCHLYHWLLSLANLVSGVFGNLFSFLGWLASLPNLGLAWLGGLWQDAVTWVGGAWQTIWGWVGNVWSNLATGIRVFFHSLVQAFLNTPIIQFLYGVLSRLELILEFGAAVFAWFINALRTLGLALISLVELIIELFQAVIQAFIDPEYDWTLVPGANPDGGFLPGDLGGDGPSPQKILWLILLGLGTLDASIGDLGVEALQYIPIGLLSIGLVLWTLKKWEFILPAA